MRGLESAVTASMSVGFRFRGLLSFSLVLVFLSSRVCVLVILSVVILTLVGARSDEMAYFYVC